MTPPRVSARCAPLRAAPLALLLFLLACAVGCASPAPQLTLRDGVSAPLSPRGPGHVFRTIEAAAVDGLLYAHLRTEAEGNRRMRGGAIRSVPGGFAYAEPDEAFASLPNEIAIALGADDVAHFHTYPRGVPSENRLNERHSPVDRANVDQIDPAGRPSFVLTPSLRVQRYDRERGERTIADLSDWLPGDKLAGLPD